MAWVACAHYDAKSELRAMVRLADGCQYRAFWIAREHSIGSAYVSPRPAPNGQGRPVGETSGNFFFAGIRGQRGRAFLFN